MIQWLEQAWPVFLLVAGIALLFRRGRRGCCGDPAERSRPHGDQADDRPRS